MVDGRVIAEDKSGHRSRRARREIAAIAVQQTIQKRLPSSPVPDVVCVFCFRIALIGYYPQDRAAVPWQCYTEKSIFIQQ